MDAETISNVNRTVVTQSRIKAGPSEGGKPQSSASSQPAQATGEDTVSLSVKSKQVVAERDAVTGASGNALDARRELDLTDGNQVVLKIKDSTTNKVIKQIPNEEELRLREAIKDQVEDQTD